MEKEGFIMETPDNHNSKSLKVFIKGSLALIGLFFTLSCGVAALLICFGSNLENNVSTLIIVIAIQLLILLVFMLIIFIRFSCLVKYYYEKIYIPLFNKKEEIVFKEHKLKMMSEACIILAKSIKPDSDKNVDVLKEFLKEIPDIFSRMSL